MSDFAASVLKLLRGEPSFRQLTAAHLYVDKTFFIRALLAESAPHFLSRPPGFGKSTLLSTLEEIFTSGTTAGGNPHSPFKGLYIDPYFTEDVQAKHYRILILRFAEFFSASGFADGEAALCRKLREIAERWQVELPSYAKSAADVLDGLVQGSPHGSVVLGIDDLDSPLVRALGRDEDYALAVQFLKQLGVTVKEQSGYCRTILLTSTLGFNDLPILTEANSVHDISHEPLFAEICGFARGEIQKYLGRELARCAAAQSGCSPPEAAAPKIESLLDKLERSFGGYCWDRKGRGRLLHSKRVLEFMASGTAELKPDPAYLSSALLSYLVKTDPAAVPASLKAQPLYLSSIDLSLEHDLRKLPLALLLLRLGFLTLQSPWDPAGFLPDNLKLGLPNLLEAEALRRALMNRG